MMKRKMMAIARVALVLVLCCSMSVNVFAESFEDTVNSSAGPIEVTVTIEKEDDTTKKTVKTEEGGVLTEDGTLVVYEETTTTVEKKNVFGNVIGTSKTVDGKEITEKAAKQKDLNADLIVNTEIQGKENGDGTHTIKVGGDISTKPTNKDDNLKEEDPDNYNQTTTTDRSAEIIITDPKVTTGDIVFVDQDGNPIFPEGYKDGYIYFAKGVDFCDVNGKYKTIVSPVLFQVFDKDGNEVQVIDDEAVTQRLVRIKNDTVFDEENIAFLKSGAIKLTEIISSNE